MAPTRPAVTGFPTIEALDELPDDAFVAACAPLFEGAPRFLARLAAARPFGSFDGLFERAREIAAAMPEDEQGELIDAHPRLGAPPASVSALSFVEQGYGRGGRTLVAAPGSGASSERLEPNRDELAAELERLNAAYEARFGFRYCVFVAGRPRAALVAELRAALDGSAAAERQRALDDVVSIAEDRLRTLAGGPS